LHLLIFSVGMYHFLQGLSVGSTARQAQDVHEYSSCSCSVTPGLLPRGDVGWSCTTRGSEFTGLRSRTVSIQERARQYRLNSTANVSSIRMADAGKAYAPDAVGTQVCIDCGWVYKG